MSVVQTRHKWILAENDREKTRALAQTLNVPPIVAHILILRGVATPEEAHTFLYPSLKHLSDPFQLTDLSKAVARIKQAKEKNEHIRIFGDYDVDGISAIAILMNGLRRFGISQLSYAMPQRLTEGYGLNSARVEEARYDGVDLIITVDNGISAHEAAQRARELGVDLIITDHHSVEENLPEALAVINPKREPETHPARELCGAGVAFKLSSALNGSPNDLDIAALGTIADIVPLLGENRAIVSLGLRHMAKHQRLGIAKLAWVAGVQIEDISSEKIGFQLGPRINAAGRLGDPETALELLLSDDALDATKIAKRLNEINEERRGIEQRIYDEAVEELEAWLTPDHHGIVLARHGWHPGVIGIVASRIENRFHRPTVLIAFDDAGTGRGSARSSGAVVNLFDAFCACQTHLERFGGHRSAAGLTIQEEHLPAFRQAFEAEIQRQTEGEAVQPELYVDVLASFSEIDSALLTTLERLQPMGHANPAPVFCSTGVELVPQSVRVLKDQHIKLSLRQGNKEFSAIGFNMAERFYAESWQNRLDVAYTPQFNQWRGETTIQLLLKDMRPCE